MITDTSSTQPDLTDLHRAFERVQKRYEFVDGKLKEKVVGFEALFIASRICGFLNSQLYPASGFAAAGAMISCFDNPKLARKPDVAFVRFDRLPDRRIPQADLLIAPDLVAEVLCPATRAIDLEIRLNDYLTSGVSMVWIVNPNRRKLRIHYVDGRTRLYRADETIADEPLLSGFHLLVNDVFPIE